MSGPNSPQFCNLDKVALRRTDPLRQFARVEGQKHTRIARSTLTNHHEGSPGEKWNRENRRESHKSMWRLHQKGCTAIHESIVKTTRDQNAVAELDGTVMKKTKFEIQKV